MSFLIIIFKKGSLIVDSNQQTVSSCSTGTSDTGFELISCLPPNNKFCMVNFKFGFILVSS